MSEFSDSLRFAEGVNSIFLGFWDLSDTQEN